MDLHPKYTPSWWEWHQIAHVGQCPIRGRCLIAKRDFAAGEFIATERKAFFADSDEEMLDTMMRHRSDTCQLVPTAVLPFDLDMARQVMKMYSSAATEAQHVILFHMSLLARTSNPNAVIVAKASWSRSLFALRNISKGDILSVSLPITK